MLALPEWIAFVVASWAVVTFSLYMYLLLSIRKRQAGMAQELWNQKVELQDLDGNVIKVPVTRVKGQNEDGTNILETTQEVAPLWYSITWALSETAASKIKMAILNQKGQLSKRLTKEVLGEEGELSPVAVAAISSLPAKWQPAGLAITKYLVGRGVGVSPGPSGYPNHGGRGGGGPI